MFLNFSQSSISLLGIMLMAETACVFLLFFLVPCPHWNVTLEPGPCLACLYGSLGAWDSARRCPVCACEVPG